MIALPHSGLTVPDGSEIRVTSLKEADMSWGVVLTAVVRAGRKRLGLAEDQGNGAGTQFMADNAATREAFAEFCGQVQLPDYLSGSFLRQEHVLEALIEEYRTGREIRQAERRSGTLLRSKTEDGWPYSTLTVNRRFSLKLDLKAIQHLTYGQEDQEEGLSWQMWDDETWVDVPAPAA